MNKSDAQPGAPTRPFPLRSERGTEGILTPVCHSHATYTCCSLALQAPLIGLVASHLRVDLLFFSLSLPGVHVLMQN